jgi:hypothetical protein
VLALSLLAARTSGGTNGRISYSRGSENRSQRRQQTFAQYSNVTVAQLRGNSSHAFEHPVSEDLVDPVDPYY